MAAHARVGRSAQFVRCAFLGIMALLILAAPGRAKAQARKIELSDLQKIVGVSEPAISPDGKSIVISSRCSVAGLSFVSLSLWSHRGKMK